MRRVVLLVALSGLLVFALPAAALAQVVAHISLSTQRMNVSVNGVPRYNWAVSTARPGYRTPTGTFKPTALFRYHASTIYSGCPTRSSSCADTRSTAPTRPNTSVGPPRMAVCGCIPPTPPRSTR